LIALLAVLAVVAAACGGNNNKKSSSGTTSTTSAGAVTEGGDVVFAAEQEPDVMDWIDSNAGAAWGNYTVQQATLPRAFDFNIVNGKPTWTPGPVLSGEPDLKTSPDQVVTYHINPKAKWSDGQPITSHDFKYTWDQIAHGKNIYDRTGYNLGSGNPSDDVIKSVDDSDPAVVVATFAKPFPAWKDDFGSNYGILPAHLLEGKDRDALMKDGYKFSGGPWMLDHWTKGVEVKLVPNPMFWGKKPHLSSITWKFITDTAAEQQAVKSGQVLAAYPQAQPGQEALKGQPGLTFDTSTGISFEALWFNVSKPPLDSVKVRQALAYATDRDAIVNQLFRPVQPDIKRIDSFATPAYGNFYSTPYSKYKVDLAKVTSLMTSDGWTKGSDGIWAKGGQRAALELKTTVNNKRRELTAQIVQNNWKQAGFDLKVTFEKAGILFGQDGPTGNFQVALYAQTPSSTDVTESSSCILWCTKNIPGPSNGNTGTNWYRFSDPRVDQLFSAVDSSLDDSKRATDYKAGTARLADLVASLPIDPFPDIIVYSDKLGGPIKHNPGIQGFWHNVNEWYLKK